MSLDEITEQDVGVILKVEPIWGWGWCRNEPDEYGIKETGIHPPQPFCARLARLLSWRGQRIGGVARIDHLDHPLDGMWSIFYLRHRGRYDFIDRLGDFNIMLSIKPPIDRPNELPYFNLEVSGMTGFAVISLASKSGPA